MAVVVGSTQVLAEIMTIPARAIPQSLLDGTQGIAILPGMLKGGFIVGVRHGRGVLLVRDEAGRAWKRPCLSISRGPAWAGRSAFREPI